MLAELAFSQAFSAPAALWDLDGITSLAGREFPRRLFLRNDHLLQTDIRALWWRWFLDAFWPIEQDQLHYAKLYESARAKVSTRYPDRPDREHRALAKLIAGSLSERLVVEKTRRELNKRRKKWTSEDRRTLLLSSGRPPRCYLCGHGFHSAAIDRFQGGGAQDVDVPTFVDVMKPRVRDADFQIEIEHVRPLKRGGVDELENLRLACSWCNRAKSTHMTLYDVAAEGNLVSRARGSIETPQSLWVVRLLATSSGCEHPGGCERTIQNDELTVFPDSQGRANPLSLGVTCYEHDPMGSDRWIARRLRAS